MESTVPDLRAIQETCREFEATLLVDIAHDFGCMGKSGGSSLENQDLLGEVDLVMGSFSKTFASNGGFVATNRESVKQFLKAYSSSYMFSNALSPIQSAAVRSAIAIVQSDEGSRLRGKVHDASARFREMLDTNCFDTLGVTSPIVPVMVYAENMARLMWRETRAAGLFLNLVEYPGVSIGRARFRAQLSSEHSAEDLAKATHILVEARNSAQDLLSPKDSERPGLARFWPFRKRSLR